MANQNPLGADHWGDAKPASRLSARLHHISLLSEAPDALANFYGRALGYRVEHADDGSLMAQAPDRRMLFEAGPNGGLSFMAYSVDDGGELDCLRQRLEAARQPYSAASTPLFESDAVSVSDPDGNRIVFGLPSVQTSSETDGFAHLDARLQHVVVASRAADRLARFYSDVLGFTISDTVNDAAGGVRTSFLRCSAEHHSLAVFQAPQNRLDHHCYETRDWNQIRDWADHLARQRIPIVWGPGRHGPGNNLFIFIHDVDGNWVELSAELETVAHDRPVGVWPHEERTLNSWGKGLLRS